MEARIEYKGMMLTEKDARMLEANRIELIELRPRLEVKEKELSMALRNRKSEALLDTLYDEAYAFEQRIEQCW